MLRGASAEARAELASKVGSGTLEDTAKLGDQLLAVAGVLRSEPALRRVFTDGSVEGEAKAGLAASVFGGKVGDPTLALVKEAVQQRWTSSRDLAGVLEELGIQALVRFPTSAVLASDQQWALREEEPFGLVPFTVDDYFARL